MDQDSLRSIATLLLFIAFVGLCIRVYSRKNKAYYEEAAQLPFADDDDAKLGGTAQDKFANGNKSGTERAGKADRGDNHESGQQP